MKLIKKSRNFSRFYFFGRVSFQIVETFLHDFRYKSSPRPSRQPFQILAHNSDDDEFVPSILNLRAGDNDDEDEAEDSDSSGN